MTTVDFENLSPDAAAQYEADLLEVSALNDALVNLEDRGDRDGFRMLYVEFVAKRDAFEAKYATDFITAIPIGSRVTNPPSGWVHDLHNYV